MAPPGSACGLSRITREARSELVVVGPRANPRRGGAMRPPEPVLDCHGEQRREHDDPLVAAEATVAQYAERGLERGRPQHRTEEGDRRVTGAEDPAERNRREREHRGSE